MGKSISFIIHNPADFAHPPGYYVLLSMARVFTDNLIILRFSSIFFVMFSMFLLWKIGEKYRDVLYAHVLVIAYSLSGYFLVTDWMIRGYALITCLILLSVYIETTFLVVGKEKFVNTKYLLILFLVHLLGLYVDYSFWWYHLGFALMIIFRYLRAKNKFDRWLDISKFAVLIASLLCFIIIYPDFFTILPKAREAMDWAWIFASPWVFLPYFFGSVGLELMSVVFLALLFIGVYLKIKSRSTIVSTIYLSAILAFTISMLVTYIYSPLFHVRNLLIVGLALTFLVAETTYWLIMKGYYFGIGLVTICFVNTFLLLLFDPRSVWIDPYPWRLLVPRYTQDPSKYYLLDQSTQVFFNNDKNTPFKVWKIEYTLEGRDALFGVNQKYVHGAPDLDKCRLLLNPLWQCRY